MKAIDPLRQGLWLLGLPAAAAMILLALSGAPEASAKPDEDGGKAAEGKSVEAQSAKEVIAESRRLLSGGEGGLEAAAQLLKDLGRRDLETADREDWLRLARTAALRQGDRARLESLRAVPDRFSLVMIQQILQASASLAAADFPKARALIEQLGDPEEMNEREKRRCYSILARLDQLEGDREAERRHIDKLVDHLHHWPRPICQSCHATLSEPEKLVHLDLSGVWFGVRFAELMREQGDAEEIRSNSASRLAKRPRDDQARIRLAYALRALGREEEALVHFRAIPWAEIAGQPANKPRMITPFP
jgi:tetratricopeptide (TPR) repeat protein